MTTDHRLPLSTVYRVAGSRNQTTRDILTTLQDHDISGSSDTLETSGFIMDNPIGGSQRRRKSPLFDGSEIVTSPKKKAKETIPTTVTTPQPKLKLTKELTNRQRYNATIMLSSHYDTIITIKK